MLVECCCVLFDCVQQYDFVIIEDDYESENMFFGMLYLVLKSFDMVDCVIYVGSLLKMFVLGLWFGYVVGLCELICELCVLWWLMVCYLVVYIQWVFVIFFVFGYYDVLLCWFVYVYSECLQVLMVVFDVYLLEVCYVFVMGGVLCWVEGLLWFDVVCFVVDVQEVGILIEFGGVFFMNDDSNVCCCFWMGFFVILLEWIELGVWVFVWCVWVQKFDV